ncbi:MAG: RsmB/NOP family class I SAM-dependent RNA methyltransferase [Deltaproteobacteria bacterium]|nr:RsmB/NOP family class I SAM-dependent RNA methyltransferase [Deltaproteobacteria bacterium]
MRRRSNESGQKGKTSRGPYQTTTRAAQGRERALTETDDLPLTLQAALDVMARQRAAGEPLDRVVADVGRERHLGPRERRATGELAFSWARHARIVQGLIDDAIAKERGMVPRRRLLDLTALCLASVANGVDVDARALAVLPDVLRVLVDDAIATGLHLSTSLPPWLRLRIEGGFGPAAPALIAALGKPAVPVLCTDPSKASVDDVIAALLVQGAAGVASPLSPQGVRVVGGRFSLAKLPKAIGKACWPMDDGSQAVALSVGALPGERVLDLCAGGGGKARLLGMSGATVIAADVDAGRLLKSLPAGVHGVVADGLHTPFLPASFDRVLVDAPCSGTGTLRRAPDLALRLVEDELPPLVELQRSLLRSALSLVKPGGVVVYATCSLLKSENEDVVDSVVGGAIKRAAPDRHLLPPECDGFFIARLTRS